MFDYLDFYKKDLTKTSEQIQTLRAVQLKKFLVKGLSPLRKFYDLIPTYKFEENDFSQDAVCFGKKDSLSSQSKIDLKQKLKNLSPWRKGPFNIAGIKLDAEWQSQRKWQRVLPELDNLKDKKIVDIGCNNGYYMYRMLEEKPEFILGIDPIAHYYYQFLALQKLTIENKLSFEPFGFDYLPLYKNFFDTAFCMGIVYHHKDPIDLLRKIHTCLKLDGQIIIESQGIVGDSSIALFPQKTYAKVKGTYFIPTENCLVNWLHRSYYKDIEIFYNHPMNHQEQRQTEWMTKQSYEDFLDPDDSSLTIEGYPAPIRIFVKARKRKI